jgi:hypothetical protein
MMDKKTKVRRHRIPAAALSAAVVMIAMFLILSCGKKKEETPGGSAETQPATQAQTTPESQPASPYDGWQRYTYGHFIGYFSPQSPFVSRKGQVVMAFDQFLAEICDILELEAPKDKIYLFVYASPMEAEGITGQSTPFMNDSSIHWGVTSAYGYELTKFVMAKNGIKPGRYNVVYEGIAHLLDFSGVNYHTATTKLMDSGRFVSAIDLGDNRIFDTLNQFVKRAESASFVGYIMYEYGTDKVFAVNQSQEFWVETVEAVFQKPFNIFAKGWRTFARVHSVDTAAVIDENATP